MRYGAFIPQGWRLDLVGIAPEEQWPTMLAAARNVEAAGAESLWVFDHFHTVPVPTQEASYEAWTLMAALAAATDTVRLGQMCTSIGYRNPAYLAKIAADIDVISGGRLEMGIGAGWYEDEYLGYGYEFPRASVRIGQLEEGVEIMRKIWSDEEAVYAGTYFQVDGAIANPKPVQGMVPMWIAGGGEQLTLRVAAKFADYTNFSQEVDGFRHKSEVLAAHCKDVGRDFDEITRSVMLNAIIDEDRRVVEDKLDALVARLASLTGEDHARRWRRIYEKYGLVGTPEDVVKQLQPLRDAGMEYLIVYIPDLATDTTTLRLLSGEVIPALARVG
jgi:F420-dependent oxidoreductase-like protein